MQSNAVSLSKEGAKQICLDTFELFGIPLENFGDKPLIEAEMFRLKSGIESGERSLFQLLAMAGDDLESFNLLSCLSADYIDHTEGLPVVLRGFVSSILRGDLTRPKKQGNRTKPTTTIRNTAIYVAIRRLESAGWRPISKNKTNSRIHKSSAIDIITESFPKALSYDAVESIWTKTKNNPPNIGLILRALAISDMSKERSSLPQKKQTGKVGLIRPETI